MTDDSDPRRDALHEFLQAQGPIDAVGTAYLTGWAIVMEWMDDEGTRWVSKGHSSSTAEWHAKGLHHEALYGDWPDTESGTA